VSDFREGSLALSASGVQIDGKTILPVGQRIAIILASVLCLGAIIVAMLLEYTFRVRRSLTLAWSAVEEVVLMPHQHRACLVYQLPEKPGQVASLAFRLDPASYAHFVQVARYFAPGKVREGPIGPPTSPRAYVITLVILVVVFLLVVAIAEFGSRHGR
jgi:hypothetical protein